MPPQIICWFCKHAEPLEAHPELNLSQRPYSGVYHCCQCGAKGSPSHMTAHGLEPSPEEVVRDFEGDFQGIPADKYTAEITCITEMDECVPLYWWK